LPSGENAVVDGHIDLLRSAGLEVEAYLRSSDEIADFSRLERLKLPIRPTYSTEDVARINAVIERFRPDVVHLHNVYPLISPAVIDRAKSHGCAVVQTVHNFRYACASGSFFREGVNCTDCIGKLFPWPAVLHGCYRQSRAESLALGTAIARHRQSWLRADSLLPVSKFVADMLTTAGVPTEKMHVVPNFVPDPGPATELGQGFLFVGRLSNEKGITMLLAAWEHAALSNETTLTIVGDGPARSFVERSASRLSGIRFCGPLNAGEVIWHMRASRAIVIPSICFEALPTVALESYACGRPIVATAVGALADLVTPDVGWRARPDEVSLATTMRQSLQDDAASMGNRARGLYIDRFSPNAVLSKLLHAYRRCAPSVTITSGS
jgi:glycosyltransferase involved in cell wall biosynthesis